jgi:putative nucleotidyltransferase with HDIG domain
MPSPAKARALVLVAAALGLVTVAAAVAHVAAVSVPTLALLAAAVVIGELIQVPGDQNSLDELDGNPFSFSTGVHIAAVLILGPWAGALVAVFGVVVADGLRRAPPRSIVYNACSAAVATAAGGLIYVGLGGQPGELSLPSDLIAVLALALTVYTVSSLFISAIVAATSSGAFVSFFAEIFRLGLPSAAGETGFGVALAVFALRMPWAMVALVPLLLALYQAYARLAVLRRQTASALETFANVVDERDSYTFRHSARVAEYVRELAEGLGLPASQVSRLRWAGRLHDLGKIAVDAAVLRKPGSLSRAELVTIRRHPRLSARLLRRFRFAAEHALAVEYHHERFDGEGYYGIAPADIPLAAHFLIVADTFDAITTDRSYRRALSREEALAEIERGLGSQFHPQVGKAFVALQRGLDPLEALDRSELASLRGALAEDGRRMRREHPIRLVRAEFVAAAGIVATLVAVAAGQLRVAPAALGLTAAAFVWWRLDALRTRRLARSLRAGLVRPLTREALLDAVVGRVSALSDLEWATLLRWTEDRLAGESVAEWHGAAPGPTAATLSSWLVREVDTLEDSLVAPGRELGRAGLAVAVPLRPAGEVTGYLVLGFSGLLPRHVRSALHDCADELAAAFDTSAEPHRHPLLAVAR